jgi:hypothetical protein
MLVPPTSLRWDFFDGMLDPKEAFTVYLHGAIPIVMADFVARHAIVVRAAVILNIPLIEVHTVEERNKYDGVFPDNTDSAGT